MAEFELGEVDAHISIADNLKRIYETNKKEELEKISQRPKYEDNAAEKLDALSVVIFYAAQINEGSPSKDSDLCFRIAELMGRIATIGKHDFPETGLESLSKKAFDKFYKNSEAVEKTYAKKQLVQQELQKLDSELDEGVRDYYKQVSSIINAIKIRVTRQ